MPVTGLSGMLWVFSADAYPADSPLLKPIIAVGVRCVAIDRVLKHGGQDAKPNAGKIWRTMLL